MKIITADEARKFYTGDKLDGIITIINRNILQSIILGDNESEVCVNQALHGKAVENVLVNAGYKVRTILVDHLKRFTSIDQLVRNVDTKSILDTTEIMRITLFAVIQSLTDLTLRKDTRWRILSNEFV